MKVVAPNNAIHGTAVPHVNQGARVSVEMNQGQKQP